MEKGKKFCPLEDENIEEKEEITLPPFCFQNRKERKEKIKDFNNYACRELLIVSFSLSLPLSLYIFILQSV